LTSRQIRERLERETRRNLAVRMEDTESPDTFIVLGRGELQLAILVETMRREGYEMQMSNPEVVTRNIDGVTCEPVELVVVDIPDTFIGVVTERLGARKGRMIRMSNPGYGRARIEYRIPSRGLIGFRSEFLTATRGMGLLNTMFDGWEPWGGVMMRRACGAMVSDRAGEATPYALFHLQARGTFFVSPQALVYEGMIIGEHNRPNDTDVNAIREKKLSNVRNHGKDENVMLAPIKTFTIETAMEWIDGDELVEVTPDAIRVRKVVLPINLRPRREDSIREMQEPDLPRLSGLFWKAGHEASSPRSGLRPFVEGTSERVVTPPRDANREGRSRRQNSATLDRPWPRPKSSRRQTPSPPSPAT
jgi:GTP-binding protein